MNTKFAHIRAEMMKFNNLNRHISFRAALKSSTMALGVMLASPALAVDGKEYPGTMCEESNMTHSGELRRAEGNIVFSGEGDALNIRTDDVAVLITCPLVRDAERSMGQITYAAVSVYKAVSGDAVICTLISKPYFGGSGWFDSKSDFSGPGLRLLEIPVKADTYISGSYNLNCWLPRTVAGQKSGIAHYGIVEAE
jgi:hypothetical protein